MAAAVVRVVAAGVGDTLRLVRGPGQVVARLRRSRRTCILTHATVPFSRGASQTFPQLPQLANIVRRVGLAAVVNSSVAVGVSRVAAGDPAGAVGAHWRGVRDLALVVALAAVVDVGSGN